MNKRTVIANLNKIANELDNSGMFNEATEITSVMKKIAQYTPPVAAPAPVPVAQPAPVAPPFGAPVVPAMPAAPGTMPAMGAPMQPAAPATATTKPPYATSAGAQGTPTPQANPADPYYLYETAEYQKGLNQIVEHFKNKQNDAANKVYEETFKKFKNPKRAQLFAQQIQRLRSQYNPAQSKPGK
jgi:hypothetical protein